MEVFRCSSPQLSITLNLHAVRPLTGSDRDLDAARRIDAVGNRVFLGPILDGEYPADLREDTAHLVDWDELVQPGDLAAISAPIDLLGVNYYNPTLVSAGDDTKVHRNSPHVWGTCTFHEYTARCPNRAGTVRAFLIWPLSCCPEGTSRGDAMTIDLEVQRHQQIWEGFTRLLKYGSIAVIIILALLAIFVV